MKIEINIDDLNQEVYSFWENGRILVLDSYVLLNRENKRNKKWKIVKLYSRLSDRRSNIIESEVPFTEEIRQMALEEFIKTLTIQTWSEYKTR